MTVIRTDQLTKIFRVPKKEPGVRGAVKALFRPQHRQIRAVDDVSFAIDRGEIVGYIGLNGAGKSTAIKMLTGILVPTAGRVQVLGRDPHKERVPTPGASAWCSVSALNCGGTWRSSNH